MYPTFSEIEKLHKKYAPDQELFDLVFIHSQIVLEIANQLLEKKAQNINKPLIIAGALLHDIGTYPFLLEIRKTGNAKYYQHSLKSAEILRTEKLPEDLCLLAEHHLGVGLTKEEIMRRDMDLPHKDLMPLTKEERLISYADKFHSKKPQFNSYESYKAFAGSFGDQNITRFEKLAEEFGIPDVETLAKKYSHPLV